MSGSTHVCAARGCTVIVAGHLLMCRPHWYAVPAQLRYQVNATYYRRNHRPADRAAYAAAVRAAVDAINSVRRTSPP